MGDIFSNLLKETGLLQLTWQQVIMIAIACVLIYLAIEKKYEPLLLLPISFGMLLANLPAAGLMNPPSNGHIGGLL